MDIILKMRKLSPRGIKQLSKVTQLVSGRAIIWTLNSKLQPYLVFPLLQPTLSDARQFWLQLDFFAKALITERKWHFD